MSALLTKSLQYALPLAFATPIALSLIGSHLGRSADSRTLRWAHVYEISSPYHQQALWAAEELERLTGGRHSINVLPASALGGESAINESLLRVFFPGIALWVPDLIYGAG